jgi:hypothetical protein
VRAPHGVGGVQPDRGDAGQPRPRDALADEGGTDTTTARRRVDGEHPQAGLAFPCRRGPQGAGQHDRRGAEQRSGVGIDRHHDVGGGILRAGAGVFECGEIAGANQVLAAVDVPEQPGDVGVLRWSGITQERRHRPFIRAASDIETGGAEPDRTDPNRRGTSTLTGLPASGSAQTPKVERG